MTPLPWQVPPPLRAGDPIVVVAPSGPADAAAVEAGLAWLRARYQVRFRHDLQARQGFLAGSDERRLAEFTEALNEVDARAIVAIRGGYGAMRILSGLPFEAVVGNPRWLVGFSDLTALHAAWARARVASLHGDMVATLGRVGSENGAPARARWQAALEGAQIVVSGVGTTKGLGKGRLLGGNLAVLSALVGTPYAVDLRGAILLLEDVGERPYRVDRMLTQLELAGAFDHLAGVALGTFDRCESGPDGTAVGAILGERFGGRGFPVVTGLPIGHGGENWPVRLGVDTVLDGGHGTLVQDAVSDPSGESP